MAFLKNISSNESTDADLVNSYRQHGDLEILAQLFQRYMDLLLGVCLKYLKDEEAAKDAVMQIFEELIIKLKKHEVTNFKSWLYMVGKNHCLMQLRSAKNVTTTSLQAELMQSGENLHQNGVMEREAQLNMLEKCIDKLPASQQQMVRLFYLDEKCYQEIVDLTGNPWNKVRSFIQNGRRNLKLCMEYQIQLTEQQQSLKS